MLRRRFRLHRDQGDEHHFQLLRRIQKLPALVPKFQNPHNYIRHSHHKAELFVKVEAWLQHSVNHGKRSFLEEEWSEAKRRERCDLEE